MLRAHHCPIPGGDKGLAEDYPRRRKPRCLRQSGPLQSELRDGGRLHHNRASQQSNSGEVVGEPTNWVVRADFPQIYPLSGRLAVQIRPAPKIRRIANQHPHHSSGRIMSRVHASVIVSSLLACVNCRPGSRQAACSALRLNNTVAPDTGRNRDNSSSCIRGNSAEYKTAGVRLN